MPPEVLEYIKTQRVGVLAVEMLDGSPHGATVHFAHTDEPLVFFFETNREYRKTEALLGRDTSRATFVLGVDEKEPKTLQLDGQVRIIKPEERGTFDQTYFGKFPAKKEKNKDQVLFVFVPTWWHYTDFTKPKDGRILSSDSKVK